MIDHLSTYATDFESTRAFYIAVLPPLGYELQEEMEIPDGDASKRRACAFGPDGKPLFWIIEAQQTYTPRHFAFAAPDRAAVAAFHTAGLAAGGKDFGEPGLRPVYHEHYYGSFLLDPDDNNVEAVCHTPAAGA
ncbi:MAG: VOC family protein [Gammaproteobacteria bacterium]